MTVRGSRRRQPGRLGVAIGVASALAGLCWLAFGAVLGVRDAVPRSSTVFIAELVTEAAGPELEPEPPPATAAPAAEPERGPMPPPDPAADEPPPPAPREARLPAPPSPPADAPAREIEEAGIVEVLGDVRDDDRAVEGPDDALAPEAPDGDLRPPAPAARPAATPVLAPAPSGPPDAPLSAIAARLESVKRYPPLAIRRGIEGTVQVRFRLTRAGAVDALSIPRSSGSSLLDAAATDTVRRGAPYPWRSGWIVVPIVFALD